jgi:hypothetical protein
MPRGKHLTAEHQKDAGSRPRLKLSSAPPKKEAPLLTRDDWEQSKYRYERARAELAEIERDKALGKLVDKDHAVDLAQQAVIRVCERMDRAIEEVRAALPPAVRDRAATIVRDAIMEARRDVSRS